MTGTLMGTFDVPTEVGGGSPETLFAGASSSQRDGFVWKLSDSNDAPVATDNTYTGTEDVTVSGNVVPAQMAELCRLASAGEHDAAKAIDDRLQPLNKALFVESNPIPVKWAVSKMGMIQPNIRLPLTECSEQYHEQMLSAMSGAGVEIAA